MFASPVMSFSVARLQRRFKSNSLGTSYCDRAIAECEMQFSQNLLNPSLVLWTDVESEIR